MNSSLEKRLAKLRQQRDSLNEQIRKVEREKATELRKLKAKKASLVGAAILSMIEDGQSVAIQSEEDLLALLDGFLVSKVDRDLFGLKVVSEGQKSPPKTPSDSGKVEDNSSSEKSSSSAAQEEDVSSDFPLLQKEDVAPAKPVSKDKDLDVVKVAVDSASLTSDKGTKKRKRSSSRLPVKDSEEDMLNEFNV